jgi:hypothetical protein
VTFASQFRDERRNEKIGEDSLNMQNLEKGIIWEREVDEGARE